MKLSFCLIYLFLGMIDFAERLWRHLRSGVSREAGVFTTSHYSIFFAYSIFYIISYIIIYIIICILRIPTFGVFSNMRGIYWRNLIKSTHTPFLIFFYPLWGFLSTPLLKSPVVAVNLIEINLDVFTRLVKNPLNPLLLNQLFSGFLVSRFTDIASVKNRLFRHPEAFRVSSQEVHDFCHRKFLFA